jgi:hypothetical protein
LVWILSIVNTMENTPPKFNFAHRSIITSGYLVMVHG